MAIEMLKYFSNVLCFLLCRHVAVPVPVRASELAMTTGRQLKMRGTLGNAKCQSKPF